MLIDYDDESKAYRCLDLLARRIVTTNDVTFFEHIIGNFVDVHNFVELFSSFDVKDDLPESILPLEEIGTSDGNLLDPAVHT